LSKLFYAQILIGKINILVQTFKKSVKTATLVISMSNTKQQTLCSKNYVANTVFNTAIPAYFWAEKVRYECATHNTPHTKS